MLIAGIDLSMTSTGVALIDPAAGATVHRVRTLGPKLPRGQKPTLLDRHDRLQEIEDRIGRLLGLLPYTEQYRAGGDMYRPIPDLLFIERPFGSLSGNTLDLTGNWWRVTGMIHRFGIPVAEVDNNWLKIYATGRASNRGPNKVEKHHVISAVKTRYGTRVARMVDGEGDDVCDAFILAAMACRMVGHPIETTELPAAHARALVGIQLPEGFSA